MAQKLESSLKVKVQRDLKALKYCWFVKVQQVGIRGTPDILACVNGRFVALELKRGEKARVDELQTYTLKSISAARGNAWIVTPESWSEQFKLLKAIDALTF